MMRVPGWEFIRRKFSTIRMRVTLWYAFFMTLLIFISLMMIRELSVKAMMSNQKENLIEIVRDGIKDVNTPGEFDYFDGSVYLLVYDENRIYQKGVIPDLFSVTQPLSHQRVQSVEAGGEVYYVYDQFVERERGSFWIRGVTSKETPDPTWSFISNVMSVFMPGIVVVSCLIGYFITKRAFRPVKKIQETAQSIADSNRISLRIGLPEGSDEIAKLGGTVDHMLDKLERSFEKEKQFTSDVSHELRTPLTVILTESEYALTDAQDLDEAKESLLVVRRQADHMSRLIHQLLFLSRSDHDALLLDKEEFEVFSAVFEVVQEYRILTEIDGTTISVTNNAAENIVIEADLVLFKRSLSNIIQNAVNYGKKGGCIEVLISQNEGYVCIEVADDGMGIAEADLDKIWDRFYQVDQSRNKSNGNSMGLGLSMVQTILTQHGGYVEVESTHGKGSKFSLFYPFC